MPPSPAPRPVVAAPGGRWAYWLFIGFNGAMALWFLASLVGAAGTYLGEGPDGVAGWVGPSLGAVLLTWLLGGVVLAVLRAVVRQRR